MLLGREIIVRQWCLGGRSRRIGFYRRITTLQLVKLGGVMVTWEFQGPLHVIFWTVILQEISSSSFAVRIQLGIPHVLSISCYYCPWREVFSSLPLWSFECVSIYFNSLPSTTLYMCNEPPTCIGVLDYLLYSVLQFHIVQYIINRSSELLKAHAHQYSSYKLGFQK